MEDALSVLAIEVPVEEKSIAVAPHPFLRSSAHPPLRSGQVSLDEAEHFLHNRNASVATLREPFAFGLECRSSSFRNQRSPSPESSAGMDRSAGSGVSV